jgi:hypothetical protein
MEMSCPNATVGGQAAGLEVGPMDPAHLLRCLVEHEGSYCTRDATSIDPHRARRSIVLIHCLCNLLRKCMPGSKASERQTVADAPAPANGKPAKDGPQRSGKRSGSVDGDPA